MGTHDNRLRNHITSVPGCASFRAERHGGIALLLPLTETARTWLLSHIDPDAEWHEGGVVIEMRYFPTIVDAVIAAGFLFEA